MFVYNVLEWVDFYSLIPIYVNIIHVRMNKVIFILYPKAPLVNTYIVYYEFCNLDEHLINIYLISAPIKGHEKLVYRLIVMFLSTEIFSKRRKIYAWMKRNQS